MPSQIVTIVGCQRSGTTLMGQIIGAHPAALMVDETDDVYRWANSFFKTKNSELQQAKIKEIHQLALTKYRIKRPLSADSFLVLQAPNLTWNHALLSNYLPNVRVIYMLRDVRSVVASMLRLPGIPFVDNQIRFFRQTGFIERDFPVEWDMLMDHGITKEIKMALVARIKMSLVDRYKKLGIPVLPIKYEDLVSEPRKTVTSITSHLGLPFNENCLGHGQVFVGHGPGSTLRTRPIDPQSLSKWREQLTPETVDSIWSVVGDFYEKLGYASE